MFLLPRPLSLGLGSLLLLTASVGWADRFYLENGGEIAGTLLNPKEDPRQSYRIEMANGIEIEVERRAVVRVDRQKPVEEEYQQIAPLHTDTIESQWELAEWCRENQLRDQREKHLRRILELDPDHKDARKALGYSQENGRWMTQKEMMESRGYVLHGGRWRLPQEIELMEGREKRERAEREYYRKFKMWRRWLEDPERREAALVQLRSLDDPFALKALGDKLEEESHFQVRLLYLETLNRMNTPAADKMIVVRSLVDPHLEVRLTAREILEKEPTPEVVTMFTRALSSHNNIIINRAAAGLAMIGDESAVGPLIDALITEHKFQVTVGNPNGGMSMSFAQPTSSGAQGAIGPNTGGLPSSGGGLSGMSMGSKTSIVTQRKQNDAVLKALIYLTDHNFGYNEKTWREWLAAQQNSVSLDPRRD
ncbi:Hypothetical protein PBC10988_38900 [Planctomycetales bacterium 10988]|nr:Hypothetical protein PBC10988_38900 [Planctomycetales bacterium 10988]